MSSCLHCCTINSYPQKSGKLPMSEHVLWECDTALSLWRRGWVSLSESRSRGRNLGPEAEMFPSAQTPLRTALDLCRRGLPYGEAHGDMIQGVSLIMAAQVTVFAKWFLTCHFMQPHTHQSRSCRGHECKKIFPFLGSLSPNIPKRWHATLEDPRHFAGLWKL